MPDINNHIAHDWRSLHSDHSFHTACSLLDKKARLNLINRAGLSPREGGNRWCQAQGNHVAPARSVRIRFKKRTFAHAGERSLRSNTCMLILRLILELGNYFLRGLTLCQPLSRLRYVFIQLLIISCPNIWNGDLQMVRGPFI